MLGPVFFNLFNLCYYIHDSNIVIYADDTVLIITGPDLNRLTQLINSELEKLSVWCQFNSLALNSDKSEFMVFTNLSINNISVIHIYRSTLSM